MAERKIRVGAGEVSREITVQQDDQDAKAWGLDAKLSVVGTEVPRVDGHVKASGSAKYPSDIQRPRMAFAKAVRSPHAHAVVKNVDVDRAKGMPGVLEARVLGRGRVTFPGAPVAVVCAETPAQLDDALAAVVVEYEIQPHVVETADALADDSPRVDPKRVNRGDAQGRPAGDPDAALAAAAVKIDATYVTHVQTHVALEPHGSVAEFDAEGRLTLWVSTQATAGCRKEAAQVAGIPEAQVRVLMDHMGGGFGCKFGLDLCDRLAIELAKSTTRPVRYVNDRREEHLTGGYRPDSIQKLTIGGAKDGTLTVLVGECFGTSGNGTGGPGAANQVLYDIPNRRVVQSGVSTFTAIGRAFRAPGHPQGVFALEGMVDEFAHAAGLDPLEVRRMNDRHPVRRLEWPIGARRIAWARDRRKVPGSDPGPVKRGVGCAGGVWYNAGGGAWRVNVDVRRDGSVTVSNGAQDIGTGTRTVLAVLVAEELGIAPSRVTVRMGDSTLPDGPGSGGSTTAPSLGPAAREAGVRAREGITAAVAKEWGVTEPGEIRFEGGKIRGPAGKETTFEAACSVLPEQGLSVSGTRRPNFDGFHGQCAGVQFAQVAVDVETGVVRVERVVAVHDAGRIIDRLTARSQVNGGVIQGISFALFEEKRLDRPTGDMVNPTYDTYRIAGMADCPVIEVEFLEMDNGINNAGMMGLGEPATVPTAAAVANAVFNATGARVRELPMTPARVLSALAAHGGTKEGARR
ncbi:MAG TPA: xanthine dehydrogenase family protein molybdopterin-binding subunit [Planctomycetota bacterium]|nr:xanthine dehydrogenase family protein molybdopterin-binding subunit [Planctomycetota bacterium]